MITVDGVTKSYGGHRAVDDVSFVARPGRVTGFLGPNGAGKSTTMRIMVGLTPASGGRVTIGGHATATSPTRDGWSACSSTPPPSTRVAPAARSSPSAPRPWACRESRVDEMLELVSLTPTEAGRRLRNYSLGMRQRLGIAHALLGDPRMLILDEPANGLDPAGIHWMRGLLREYAGDGGTVLLSSHLLHEVEKIADDLVLIGRGRIVAQGTKQELLQTRGAYVRAAEHRALVEALHRHGIHAVPSGTGLRSDAEPRQIGTMAAAEGLALEELRPAEGAGLEDLFLQLTADTQREGEAA